MTHHLTNRFSTGIFLFCFWVPLAQLRASTLAPHLTPHDIQEIRKLKTALGKSENLEEVEKSYHQLTERQILTDLIELYSRPDEVEMAFPSFTPDGPHRINGDLGFGFHVVRRLRYSTSDGEEKIIEVNEAWNQDRESGGLFLPDDIRVKTRYLSGERHVPGSDEQYLYDVFRISWGPTQNPPQIYRRTRYTWDAENKMNFAKILRVPVSSPLSCIGCHKSPERRAKRFLSKGETIDYERIVQNSQFTVPPMESLGFQEFMKHLSETNRPESLKQKIQLEIQNPKQAFSLPIMSAAWRELLKQGTQQWLGDDLALSEDEIPTYQSRQGFYFYSKKPRLDILERVHSGKYESWFPQVAFPKTP